MPFTTLLVEAREESPYFVKVLNKTNSNIWNTAAKYTKCFLCSSISVSWEFCMVNFFVSVNLNLSKCDVVFFVYKFDLSPCTAAKCGVQKWYSTTSIQHDIYNIIE